MFLKQTPTIFSFIIIAVILLLIFFNFQGWLAGIKNFSLKAAQPFLDFFYRSGDFLSDSVSFWFTLKDLARENSSLRLQNNDLRREIFSLQEAVRENEVLRSRLALPSVTKQKAIFADVIGYNPQLGQHVLINKGSADGLAIGQAAVDEHNFLVGKVIEVEESFARVLLISDSNSLVNALSQERRLAGLVRGEHGLGLAMEMIPIDQEIKVGETIFTSGLNDALPKNLIIGKVKGVIKKESEIFQKANIEPAANLKNPEKVFILLPEIL